MLRQLWVKLRVRHGVHVLALECEEPVETPSARFHFRLRLEHLLQILGGIDSRTRTLVQRQPQGYATQCYSPA